MLGQSERHILAEAREGPFAAVNSGVVSIVHESLSLSQLIAGLHQNF